MGGVLELVDAVFAERTSKALATLACLLVLAVSDLGQASVSALPWAGQAVCAVNAQQDGYTHQETQTWTITGTAPRADSNMPVYDATWSFSGAGSTQRVRGPQAIAAGWNRGGTPVNTAIAIAVRPNGQLFIKSWRSQLHSVGATTGMQRAVTTGAQPSQTAINSDVYEWPFPVIEAAGNSLEVTGTGTIVVNGGLLPLQMPSTNFTATCEWHFGRGVGASPRELKTPNLAVLNPGLAAGGVVPQGSAGGAAVGSGSAGSAGAGAGAGVPSQASAGGAAGGSAGGAAAGSVGSAGSAGSRAGAGGPSQGSAGGAAGGSAGGAAAGSVGSAGAAGSAATGSSAGAGGSGGASTCSTSGAAGAPQVMAPLTATIGAGTVTLTWPSPVGSGAIDFYEVEAQPAGSAAATQQTVKAPATSATLPLSTCPYPSGNCSAAGGYTFRVRAHNGAGCGPYSSPTGNVRPLVSYVGDNVAGIWAASKCLQCHTGPKVSLDLSGTASESYNRVGLYSAQKPGNKDRLLACPTGGSCASPQSGAHPGGQGFSTTSIEYLLLLQWIQDGFRN